MRRLGRGLLLLFRLLGGLFAGLSVLVALVCWRLLGGPISLDFLAPHVASALDVGNTGSVVSVDHTRLSFGEDARVELVAEGVHLSQAPNGATLTLPELELGVSPYAALFGILAPTHIILRGPEFHLEREADGSLRLDLGGGGGGEAGAGGWAADLLADLANPPNRQGPWGYLTEVAVRGASLRLDDRSLGLTLRGEAVDAAFYRGSEGLSGSLRLILDAGQQKARLHGEVTYRRAIGRIAAGFRVADFRPAAWAVGGPVPPLFAAVDLPLAGELRAELDARSLAVRSASLALTLGGGQIKHPALATGALAVKGGAVKGDYDPAASRFAFSQLALDLDGPSLAASGSIVGLAPDVFTGRPLRALGIAADVELQNLGVDDFRRFWPAGLAPNARSWATEHLHDGVVTDAKLALGLHLDLPTGAPAAARLERFEGSLAYRDLTVDYFKPLPPARNIAGTAVFDRKHIDFTPAPGASAGGVQVSGGLVHLYQLDTNDERIAIDLGVHGAIRDLLQAIDARPLGYAHEIGIDPAHVSGDFDGRLTLGFPLLNKLPFSQVAIGAHAHLTGVAMEGVALGHDLSAGDLALTLDPTRVAIEGQAKIAGVPATLDWTEALRPAAVRTHYAVRARLDDAARRTLGLELPPDRLGGVIAVDLTYDESTTRKAAATLNLDLADAEVGLKELGWSKPRGSPAAAALKLALANDRLTAIEDATFSGGGLDLRLAADFGADRQPLRIDVKNLHVGETDVAGLVTPITGGGWRVELRGRALDATAALADLEAHPSTTTEPGPPLVIDVRLDRLILGPKREADNLVGQLYSDGIHWQAITIDTAYPGGGKAAVRLGTSAGRRRFNLTTDDFGNLLRLLDVSEHVRGGQLQVSGDALDEGARRVLKGRVDATQYQVVNAPLLARLLSLASFSGIVAMLSGEGVPFTRLQADFVYEADVGRITVPSLRTYGGAIGINLSGVIERRAHTVNVSGTLVPAYTLNSVLGNIPLLGNLLLGGPGEGIFGANFRIAGASADPQISVNPLSALAPGFLRKLFLFDAWNPAPASTAPGGAANQRRSANTRGER